MDNTLENTPRRRLLQSIPVAGAVWHTPTVHAVILPEHAVTTATITTTATATTTTAAPPVVGPPSVIDLPTIEGPKTGGLTDRIFSLANCGREISVSRVEGEMVLPGIYRVRVPTAEVTLRFGWDALFVPDRFVVVVGDQIAYDTEYVSAAGPVLYSINDDGDDFTHDINPVLAAHGLPLMTQTEVNVQRGARMAEVVKPAGVEMVYVAVYAPFQNTQWHWTMIWECDGA